MGLCDKLGNYIIEQGGRADFSKEVAFKLRTEWPEETSQQESERRALKTEGKANLKALRWKQNVESSKNMKWNEQGKEGDEMTLVTDHFQLWELKQGDEILF